ncbi:hypothetical protein EVAR_46466_1 [Eumeta japonica]|uniref:Uncharacterized protein n=1 Tax=Eumeta variegata TaxID=151549 RepID=A0A4C1XK28_EUMVA|nr:hypothetical protein EVAR_46466_1 [Eumeta japonica]
MSGSVSKSIPAVRCCVTYVRAGTWSMSDCLGRGGASSERAPADATGVRTKTLLAVNATTMRKQNEHEPFLKSSEHSRNGRITSQAEGPSRRKSNLHNEMNSSWNDFHQPTVEVLPSHKRFIGDP